MNVDAKWRALGWRHPLWDYVRFYSVVQRQKTELRDAWEEKLKGGIMEIDESYDLPVPTGHAELFFDYLRHRERDFGKATNLLRTEQEALAYCEKIRAEVKKTKTRNQDHHQSSAAMVAAVSYVAGEHCLARGMGFVKAPIRRCVWLASDQLHVTARNSTVLYPPSTPPRWFGRSRSIGARLPAAAR